MRIPYSDLIVPAYSGAVIEVSGCVLTERWRVHSSSSHVRLQRMCEMLWNNVDASPTSKYQMYAVQFLLLQERLYPYVYPPSVRCTGDLHHCSSISCKPHSRDLVVAVDNFPSFKAAYSHWDQYYYFRLEFKIDSGSWGQFNRVTNFNDAERATVEQSIFSGFSLQHSNAPWNQCFGNIIVMRLHLGYR